MTVMTLSLFNPNSLLPHRAGVAGLALALSALDFTDAPLKPDITDDKVKLTWDCTDKEAIQWLVHKTYQIKDGYLNVKALRLEDKQSRYIFTEGVISTFLQHSKQRSLEKKAIAQTLRIDENQAELKVSYKPLLNCYYVGGFKEAFNSKGKFKKKIPIKGHHLPGLVEDFANGAYQESPENYLALLFLPIACHYYRLPNFESALVIPTVHNLKIWIKQRPTFATKTIGDLTSYGEFRATGTSDAALRFLLKQKLNNEDDIDIDYCEVYRLGKQPWDANQLYLKQAVYRIKPTYETLRIYERALGNFTPTVQQNEEGKTWLAESKILPLIAENLIQRKSWYQGFFEFRKKTKQIYERKKLVKMTQMKDMFNQQEKIFFDAIQGAFGKSLWEENERQKDQKADYESIYKKALYRLQRPSTKSDFARAVVLYLGRYSSKASTGYGEEIYVWLHREHNWRKARDLAILALSTYGKKSEHAVSQVIEEEDDLP